MNKRKPLGTSPIDRVGQNGEVAVFTCGSCLPMVERHHNPK